MITDTPATPRGRSLSGPITVTLDFLDVLQVQSALEYRVGYFSGMARELRDRRMTLGDPKPGVGEEMLAISIASVQRALRTIDEALGYHGTPDPMGPREGETESELRAAWGDR
jgi:hypothetical protein